MKRFPLALTALIVPAAIGLAVAASAASDTTAPNAQTFFGGPCAGYGQGAGAGWGAGMGRGRGAARGMGPGMHRTNWSGGQGAMGPGNPGMGRGIYWADANHDGTLTVDEVKVFLEAHQNRPGFEGLKIGAVKEKDDTTIAADIVTKDGAPVRTLEFPRKVDTAAAGPQFGPGFGPGLRGGHRGFGQGFGPGATKGFNDRGFQMGMMAGLLADGQLSVDEVKGLVEHRLAMWNNPNLKVGEVKEKDATTISADIVTKDGSLVEHMEFDRKTGRPAATR